MRPLTDHEIALLESQYCTSDDWTAITVDDDFTTGHLSYVHFFGTIQLGVYDSTICIHDDFYKPTGIHHATLHNVTIGDNCLIEHVANYISNYHIGDNSVITNVGTIATTAGATFGEGTTIAVMNEAGEGNICLHSALTAQTAAMMVKYASSSVITAALRQLITRAIATDDTRGSIGPGVRINNTQTIINTILDASCEVDGALRLADSTIHSTAQAPTYIGAGVIIDNTIILPSTSILNNVTLESCFVDEACCIKNGFCAENSVFCANSILSHGEAAAALCGPFTASHHRSTLLIGTSCSFFNAGASTIFSNHAYKMGPIHSGSLARGSKTAIGAQIAFPATIGAFSTCIGHLHHHPDTTAMPFSYLIVADNGVAQLLPGRAITSIGLFRDTHKWPHRDRRQPSQRGTLIHYHWLSPYTIQHVLTGKRTLETMQQLAGKSNAKYSYQGFSVSATALQRGIDLYTLAVRLFLGMVVTAQDGEIDDSRDAGAAGRWTDLLGLLLPVSDEQFIVSDLAEGSYFSLSDLLSDLRLCYDRYDSRCWQYAAQLLREQYHVESLTPELLATVRDDYAQARQTWVDELRKDAYKEYNLGDVDEATLAAVLRDLDKYLAE